MIFLRLSLRQIIFKFTFPAFPIFYLFILFYVMELSRLSVEPLSNRLSIDKTLKSTKYSVANHF